MNLAPISTPACASASPSWPITHRSARPNKAVATLVSIDGKAIAQIARCSPGF